MIDLNADPAPRTLRQFGAGAAAVLLGLAAIRVVRHGGSPSVLVFAAVAVLAGIFAWLRPQALRLPFVLLSGVTVPIGRLVSQLVVLVLFYGMITPLAALARLGRTDPLRLRFDRQAQSYWHPRPRPHRDRARYLRQA